MKRYTLSVFLRSCTSVESFHGTPRVDAISKSDLAMASLRSLLATMHDAVERGAPLEPRLRIMDDHSDARCIDSMRALLAGARFPTELVPLAETGNGASLLATFRAARDVAGDLTYFVEDDYLHARTALYEMTEACVAFEGRMGRPVAIFPCDHPDRYRDPYPSLILAASRRHWRTVLNSTGTLLVPRAVLEAHWERFVAFARYGIDPEVTEDNTLNLIYRETPCFSPMPTLAVHVQDEKSLSPYVDWKSWWPS